MGKTAAGVLACWAVLLSTAAFATPPKTTPAALAPLVANVDFYGADVPSAYLDQPLLAQVAAPSAPRSASGHGVIVAVIDNGVDPFNPVLQGSLLTTEGWNFYNGTANWSAWADLTASGGGQRSVLSALLHAAAVGKCPVIKPLPQAAGAVLSGTTTTTALLATSDSADGGDDPKQALQLISAIVHCDPAFGHGTAVAGLIHLIAPEAAILPIKAFGPGEEATVASIVNSIHYAVAHHARVINLSFSAASADPLIQEAIAGAIRQGVVVVAAAGNGDVSAATYPASQPGVIGVGAVDGCLPGAPAQLCVAAPLPERALFSNFDPPSGILDAEVGAPGVRVLTTFPGFGLVWAVSSGTSFSAAIVAGEAALLAGSGQTAAQIAAEIEASSDPAIPADADGGLGYGMVQILGALKLEH
ncbi:MAG: S8 family serine peptidase [Terriglobales bacterium]